MKIINLTGHEIKIEANNKTYIFEDSGLKARCKISMERTNNINGIPCHYKGIDDIVSILPAPQKDTLYLVSSMTMDNNPTRGDLISPNTARNYCIKNKHGKIIGARGFQRIKQR